MHSQMDFRLATAERTFDAHGSDVASVRLDSFGHEFAIALRFAYDTDGEPLEVTAETRAVNGELLERQVTVRLSGPLARAHWLAVLRSSLVRSQLYVSEVGITFA